MSHRNSRTLHSPHRLQLRWEGGSGVPGVVSVMQCGYCQCHSPQCAKIQAPPSLSAAHIRLNYRQSGLSAGIGGGFLGRGGMCSVFMLPLPRSLSAPPSLSCVTTHKRAHTLLILDAISLDHWKRLGDRSILTAIIPLATSPLPQPPSHKHMAIELERHRVFQLRPAGVKTPMDDGSGSERRPLVHLRFWAINTWRKAI